MFQILVVFHIFDAPIGGITRSTGGAFRPLKNEIIFSKGLKGFTYNGVNIANPSIVHEFIHAYHFSIGLPMRFRGDDLSEISAWNYSQKWATVFKTNGYYNAAVLLGFGSANTVDPRYSWSLLNDLKIIKMGVAP